MSFRSAVLAMALLALAAGRVTAQQCSGTVLSVPITPGPSTGNVSISDFDAGSIVYQQNYRVDLTGTTGGAHAICVSAPQANFLPAPWSKPSADITVRMIAPTTGATVALSTTEQSVGNSNRKNVVTLEVRVALSYVNDIPGSYLNSMNVTVYK